MTVTITATSREQLDELYRTLSDAPDGQDGAVGGSVQRRAMPRLAARARGDYSATLQAMRDFTAARGADTARRALAGRAPPVYTQGVAGRAATTCSTPDGIPVLQTKRGGQVTYHGPGQVVAYPLVDLRAPALYVKEYVYRLEQAVLELLEAYGVTGHRVAGAPGIYVRLDDPFGHAALMPRRRRRRADRRFRGLGKIAALGIKVSRHCAYHGVALNVDMDLEPFDGIDPCGYAGLCDGRPCYNRGVHAAWHEVARRLGPASRGRCARAP